MGEIIAYRHASLTMWLNRRLSFDVVKKLMVANLVGIHLCNGN